MEKNNGAAAVRPTNAGLAVASKLPTHTASTKRPTTPTLHASRKPKEVPVFQATGGAASVRRRAGAFGRGTSYRASSTRKLASALKRRREGGAPSGRFDRKPVIGSRRNR